VWRADVPWSAIFVEHLEMAARQSYSLDGLRFELGRGDTHEVYLAAFNAVIEDAKLARIRGVARNITELADLSPPGLYDPGLADALRNVAKHAQVQSAHGQFSVDTAPGKGCRVAMDATQARRAMR
jgi:hypothetical protein